MLPLTDVHREGGIQKAAEQVAFSREQIQKYIQFARCLNPRMTRASRKVSESL
jgi:DNA-binding phage protein